MKRLNLSEMGFQVILILIFTAFALLCTYPFYYMLVYSLSDSRAAAGGGFLLWPLEFTLENYKKIFALPGIFPAFGVSIARTVVGTLATLFFSSMLAYALTRDKLPGRKIFYKIVVISMYLNAGIIPWYIVMLKLGMKNNPLLYILPSAVTAYFLILIKTYIEQLPASLIEAAKLDGAGEFQIYARIVIPLCKPILAAVAVFSAVNHWNSWQDNFFLIDNPALQTLQKTLLNYLNQAEAIAQQVKTAGGLSSLQSNALSPMSIRMTMTMVVALPIIMVYPFMQKHFVKGIMVGAVKG